MASRAAVHANGMQLLRCVIRKLTSGHMSSKEDVLVCLCPHVLLCQLQTIRHLHIAISVSTSQCHKPRRPRKCTTLITLVTNIDRRTECWAFCISHARAPFMFHSLWCTCTCAATCLALCFENRWRCRSRQLTWRSLRCDICCAASLNERIALSCASVRKLGSSKPNLLPTIAFAESLIIKIRHQAVSLISQSNQRSFCSYFVCRGIVNIAETDTRDENTCQRWITRRGSIGIVGLVKKDRY